MILFAGFGRNHLPSGEPKMTKKAKLAADAAAKGPPIDKRFISMSDCDIESMLRTNETYQSVDPRHTIGKPSPFLKLDPDFDFVGTFSVEPMHTLFHGAVKGLFEHALFNSKHRKLRIAG